MKIRKVIFKNASLEDKEVSHDMVNKVFWSAKKLNCFEGFCQYKTLKHKGHA